MNKIRFTCVECHTNDLTEADGLEMELGFVCATCLHATSEVAMYTFIDAPEHKDHTLEELFPNGLTDEQAHNVQDWNDMGLAVIEHHEQQKEKHYTIPRWQKWIAAIGLIAILSFFAVSFANASNEVSDNECLNGTWTWDGYSETFVCVPDGPEGYIPPTD